MKVEYRSDPPAEYHCEKCKASGVKLWRTYSDSHVELNCYDCACADNPEKGSMPNSDQIGWLVPAIPDEEDVGYWGYTSVPPLACDWWWRMPPFADSMRVLNSTRGAMDTLDSGSGEYMHRLANQAAEAITILASREAAK